MFLITEFKRCRCCQETLPARDFHFIPSLFRLHSWCKQCHSGKKNERYLRKKKEIRAKQKAYYEVNKKEILASQKTNPRVRRYMKLYRATRRDKISKTTRAYNAANKSKVRATRNRYQTARKKTDLAFKFSGNLRSRICKVLAGKNKSASTVALLGCSIELFLKHLEKQFQPGMTWKNHGSIWHIDHIRPCVSFDLADPEQQKICFHYTNLQPLFALDNLQKGDRVPNS